MDTTGTAVFGSSVFVCFLNVNKRENKIGNGYVYTIYIFNVNKSSMVLWFLAVPRGDLAEDA